MTMIPDKKWITEKGKMAKSKGEHITCIIVERLQALRSNWPFEHAELIENNHGSYIIFLPIIPLPKYSIMEGSCC